MARLHDDRGLTLRMEEVLDEYGQTVMREGRAVFRLLDPLFYHVGDYRSPHRIEVPVGFETDLASVPRAFRGLIPATGPWQRAAVIHDYLYKTQGATLPPTLLRGRTPRKTADDIFLEAMEAAGVAWITRSAIYRAVRIGGNGGWGL